MSRAHGCGGPARACGTARGTYRPNASAGCSGLSSWRGWPADKATQRDREEAAFSASDHLPTDMVPPVQRGDPSTYSTQLHVRPHQLGLCVLGRTASSALCTLVQSKIKGKMIYLAAQFARGTMQRGLSNQWLAQRRPCDE